MIKIATTGIWKIDKRLDHVIDYITDPEKTINEDYINDVYNELHSTDEYLNVDIKNEKKYYVSGINCCEENAYEEMMLTKKSYSKTKGILGFHSFQSFKENEVTPELSHEIGVRLAEEMWGDRFEVMVSTHVNTNHIHNHFVINSVSFKDGKKYYDNRINYAKLRRLSDELCEEYGLSILKEKPCKRSKINYENYYLKYTSNDNYYTTAKADVDRAIGQAYSYKDFENLMKSMDYKIIYRGNNILSIRRTPYNKNIRLERNFGKDYSINRIKERIEETQHTRIPFMEEYGIKKNNRNLLPKKRNKNHGIYGLYLYYCYLLKVFPKHYPRQRLSANIRADIKKMESISNQTKLLVSNKITTYEQFFSYFKKVDDKLNLLVDKRSKLCIKYNKTLNLTEKDELQNEIKSTYEEIKKIRKKVKICEEIDNSLSKIKKNIDDFEKENSKEVQKDELIK